MSKRLIRRKLVRKKLVTLGRFIKFPFINLSIEYYEGKPYGLCVADENGCITADSGEIIADDFWSWRTTLEWRKYMKFNERYKSYPSQYKDSR